MKEPNSSEYALDLHHRRIRSIQGLTGYKKVRVLDLSSNEIEVIQGLDSLKDLKELKLYFNKLSEIQGLTKNKKLENLYLNNNFITVLPKDMTVLSHLKIFDISHNKITKIENLTACGALEVVNLSNNQITQISGLNGLISITELDLSYNKITQIAELGTLKNIRELNIEGNQIDNLNGLKSLKSLVVLHISSNPISNYDSLPILPNLEELYSSDLPMYQITKLNEFTSLEILDIQNCQIQTMNDIKLLKNSNVRELLLVGNPIMNNVPEIRSVIEEYLPELELFNDVYTVYGNINCKVDDSLYNILPPPLFFNSIIDSGDNNNNNNLTTTTNTTTGNTIFNSTIRPGSARPLSATGSRPGTANSNTGTGQRPIMRSTTSRGGNTIKKAIDVNSEYMNCMQKIQQMRNELTNAISNSSNTLIPMKFLPSRPTTSQSTRTTNEDDIESIPLTESVRTTQTPTSRRNNIKAAFTSPLQSSEGRRYSELSSSSSESPLQQQQQQQQQSQPTPTPPLKEKRSRRKLGEALSYSRKGTSDSIRSVSPITDQRHLHLPNINNNNNTPSKIPRLQRRSTSNSNNNINNRIKEQSSVISTDSNIPQKRSISRSKATSYNKPKSNLQTTETNISLSTSKPKKTTSTVNTSSSYGNDSTKSNPVPSLKMSKVNNNNNNNNNTQSTTTTTTKSSSINKKPSTSSSTSLFSSRSNKSVRYISKSSIVTPLTSARLKDSNNMNEKPSQKYLQTINEDKNNSTVTTDSISSNYNDKEALDLIKKIREHLITPVATLTDEDFKDLEVPDFTITNEIPPLSKSPIEIKEDENQLNKSQDEYKVIKSPTKTTPKSPSKVSSKQSTPKKQNLSIESKDSIDKNKTTTSIPLSKSPITPIENPFKDSLKPSATPKNKKKIPFLLGNKQDKWQPKPPPKIIENGEVKEYPSLHTQQQHVKIINESSNNKENRKHTPIQITAQPPPPPPQQQQQQQQEIIVEDRTNEKPMVKKNVEMTDSEIGTEVEYTGQMLQLNIIEKGSENPNYFRVQPITKYKTENRRPLSGDSKKCFKSFHLPSGRKSEIK